MKKNVTILNFSPRKNGNCQSICNIIRTFYGDSNTHSFMISDVFTPCGGCNYECLKPEVHCASLSQSQADIYDTIRQSDLVYYIVPNFCGMPNSVYYAFNERSVGYFKMNREIMEQYLAVRKRFIFISNTERGTFIEAMQQQAREPYEVLFMKTSHYGKKSIAGDMMVSEQAQADLMTFLKK